MDHAARDVDVGLWKPVEGVVRHPVFAEKFRLRVGSRKERPGQQRSNDGERSDQTECFSRFHRKALRCCIERRTKGTVGS